MLPKATLFDFERKYLGVWFYWASNDFILESNSLLMGCKVLLYLSKEERCLHQWWKLVRVIYLPTTCIQERSFRPLKYRREIGETANISRYGTRYNGRRRVLAFGSNKFNNSTWDGDSIIPFLEGGGKTRLNLILGVYSWKTLNFLLFGFWEP